MKNKRSSRSGGLDNVENKLERIIEGPFSRIFRSPLQPAEIEKAAIKEVERTRKLGVSTIYVANVYSVIISAADSELLGDLIETLRADLATRIFAYASNNNYRLPTRTIVNFAVDDDMKLGSVFVIGEIVSPEKVAEEFGEEYLHPGSPVPISRSGVYVENPEPLRGQIAHVPEPSIDYFASDPQGAPASAPVAFASAPVVPTPELSAFRNDSVPISAMSYSEHNPQETPFKPTHSATLTINNLPAFILGSQERYSIGRQSECEIHLEDSQISRRHAEIIRDGSGWAILDLQSTNGTLVNGERVSQHHLRNGDVVTVGTTTIRYRETES